MRSGVGEGSRRPAGEPVSRSIRRSLAALGATLLVAGSLASCGEPPPPNVLLISIDTLRADFLTPYGSGRETSPNIASLAEQGILFERAYSQSPKTATSHMSLFTGLYPSVHGVVNFANLPAASDRALSPDVPLFAEILEDAGYRTAAVVGGGNVSDRLGFDRGFSSYEEIDDASEMVDRAEELLGELAPAGGAGEPFFLFLHTLEVHDPYLPRPEVAERFVDPEYDGEVLSTEHDLRAAAGDDSHAARYNAYWARVDPRSEADARHLRDLYAAEIRFTDEQLGRLFRDLERRGLLESTIVVLLSDHGEEFFEHGSVLHGTLYDEVLHVPLVFRIPERFGIESGRRIPATVRLVDVAPTLLDLLGLETPSLVQGHSLVPMLRGEDRESRDVFAERLQGARRFSLRRGDWKYLKQSDVEELYDLRTDPGETVNRASEEPRLVEAFRREVASRAVRNGEAAARLSEGEQPEIDEETRRRLEALGYLDSP